MPCRARRSHIAKRPRSCSHSTTSTPPSANTAAPCSGCSRSTTSNGRRKKCFSRCGTSTSRTNGSLTTLCRSALLRLTVVHNLRIWHEAATAPEIPRRHRAVRVPRPGDFFDGARRRHFRQTELDFDGHPQAEVADGEDVRPAQRKDLNHLQRPRAEAVNW